VNPSHSTVYQLLRVRPTATPERLAALAQLGGDLVEGDLKDRATIAAACQGVETIISTATTTLSRQAGDTIEAVDLAGQLELAGLAAEAAVRHMRYVSISGGQHLPAVSRQASGGAAPRAEWDDLHHRAADLLHGGLAQPDRRFRL
jgi:uncharacterized protein YbjT (DUF2867 family)